MPLGMFRTCSTASAALGRCLGVLLTAGCLLTASPIAAAYESRGTRSCAGWQQSNAEEQDGYPRNMEIYQTWLIGYLSGSLPPAPYQTSWSRNA